MKLKSLTFSLLFFLSFTNAFSAPQLKNSDKQISVVEKSLPISFRISHGFNFSSNNGKAVSKLKEILEAKFQTKFNILLDENSSIYNNSQEIESLELGITDLVIVKVDKIEEYFKLKDLSVFKIPYLFSDSEYEKFFSSNIAAHLLAKINQKSLQSQALSFWLDDTKVLLSTKPINSIQNFQSLRFGTKNYEINKIFIKGLNANPVVLNNFSNFYLNNSLKSKNANPLDVVEVSVDNITSGKLYDSAKNILVSNHNNDLYVVLINKNWFSQLPNELKTELSEVIKDFSLSNLKVFKEANEKTLNLLEASFEMKIVTPKKSFLEEMQKSSIDVKYYFSDNINKDILVEIEKLLKKK